MVNKGYDKEIWSPEQLESMDKFIQGKRKDPPLLSDEDWEAINRKAGVDVIDIVVNLDGRYAPHQQADLIAERCNLTAKAQWDICKRWYKDGK